MNKEELKQLRNKLITWEHGKAPKGYEPPYWDCECFPMEKVRRLVKIFNSIKPNE